MLFSLSLILSICHSLVLLVISFFFPWFLLFIIPSVYSFPIFSLFPFLSFFHSFILTFFNSKTLRLYLSLSHFLILLHLAFSQFYVSFVYLLIYFLLPFSRPISNFSCLNKLPTFVPFAEKKPDRNKNLGSTSSTVSLFKSRTRFDSRLRI